MKKSSTIKKAQTGTAAKKSGPPAAPTTRPWKPNAMVAGKDFGKKGSKGAYYYMEGTKMGGQGGLKNQKDMPSLDGKRTIREVERQNEFNRSLITPRKKLVTKPVGKAKKGASVKKSSVGKCKSGC